MTQSEPPWVTTNFGLAVTDGAIEASAESVVDLIVPGLRRNPRRAHLLVSTVLGKHIPVLPDRAIGAAHRLGARVSDVLGADVGDLDVLGMAETATSLGHCVADELDAASYLHTTRRDAADESIYASFQEGHSHATDHTLQPAPFGVFATPRPLVLVDDEISTGKTALAAIGELHRHCARPRYVVASLVDLRDTIHRAAVDETATRIGADIEFVSLATGIVRLPEGLIEAVLALDPPTLNLSVGAQPGTYRRLELDWPADVPDGGRHGFLRADRAEFETALRTLVEKVVGELTTARHVLVIGHEELMYLPLRLSESLAGLGFDTTFQSTTRSPAYVRDVPGYPLRRGFTFHACEAGEDAARYLYNATHPGVAATVVLVVDIAADTDRLTREGGMVDVLSTAGFDVLVTVVRGTDVDVLAARRADGSRCDR